MFISISISISKIQKKTINLSASFIELSDLKKKMEWFGRQLHCSLDLFAIVQCLDDHSKEIGFLLNLAACKNNFLIF